MLPMRRGSLFVVLLLVVVTVILNITLWMSSITSPKAAYAQSEQILKNLCQLYQDQKIGGNLCDALCDSQTFKYEDYLTYGIGKTVIAATYNSKKVLFKSKYERFGEYDVLFNTNEKRGIAPSNMDYNSFLSLFKIHVESLMGIKVKDKETVLLSKMWTSPISPNTELTPAEMNSMWTLVQQPEFNYRKYFHGADFLPEIYGSCGHFYATEYIPSGGIDFRPFNLSDELGSATWPNRARIALDLLDLVNATETFYSEKLHLCEVKPDKFGITDNFLIKAVDIDISLFASQIRDYWHQKSCNVNEECDIIDCRGACNYASQTCVDVRMNDNFQAMCEYMFLPHSIYPGLLSNSPPHIADKIAELLEKCINPPSAERVHESSETKTFKKLHLLLSKEIQEMLLV